MKNRRSWVGVICCSLLFIAVCLSLVINMKGVLPAPGDPAVGLLFFMVPGIVAGLVARRRRAIVPLVGAVLAAPVCYLLIHLLLTPVRSFWQEVAWLFSAVFWCGMGGLGCYFVHKLFKPRKRL
ncbi:inner membrane protein YbjM [Kosakonia sp. H02]|nr:inner membrane protein YbjM [Kosakonia sp. H02]